MRTSPLALLGLEGACGPVAKKEGGYTRKKLVMLVPETNIPRTLEAYIRGINNSSIGLFTIRSFQQCSLSISGAAGREHVRT